MRRVLVRSLAVLLLGLAVLAGILYYASTVDGRPPGVDGIALTQHLSGDDAIALTTTSIEVRFSEPVQTDTAEAAFVVEPPVEGAFSWSGSTLTFTPEERLPLDTAFKVRIQEGVRDLAGNRMADASQLLAFETVGHPSIASSDPEDGAQDVPLDAPIVLSFSTLMDTASVEAALEIVPYADVTANWSGEELTLTPAEPLSEGRQYVVRISTDALDSVGNPLEEPFRLVFRAARSGVEVETLFPADGSEGIALRTPLAIVFDRELDPDSLDDGSFSIEPQVAGSLDLDPLPGAAGVRQPGVRMLHFQPSGQLEPNTTYTVTLRPGLAGADGSRLAAAISWSFTTGAPTSALSNQVVFLSDRAGIANLWTMNPDGTGQRQLSSELSPVVAYAVAPDGRSFVVGDGAVLVEQRIEDGQRRRLTPAGVLEFDPAYAPDGSSFAFGRADAETGAGLGLWTTSPGSGDAVHIELPEELVRSPSPSPAASASGEQPPASILRAPRYSPDGAALAFVDTVGRIGVLELPADRLSTAPFVATSPPAWLADSTAILVSGLSSARVPPPAAGEPLPPFDPAELGLSSTQLGSLRLVQLDRGASRVTSLGHGPGAARPAAGPASAYLFVTLDSAGLSAAGELRVVSRFGTTTTPLQDDGAPVTSAQFGLESQMVVLARLADPEDSAAEATGGIWVVDTGTHRAVQLAQDGWLPRWLP